MRILLSNDDGFFAPGLQALRKELQRLGTVTVVAPAEEQSGTSHGLTITQPLLIERIDEDGELVGYAVEGKPADCVKLALMQLMDERPDLVVSGLNAGANAGINVLYSGTVAAAVEGSFMNLTAVAVSLAAAQVTHFAQASVLAVQVIRQILDQNRRPGELFNVNIPDLEKHDPTEVVVCEQGLVCYDESYERRCSPRGQDYFWLLGDPLDGSRHPDSDLAHLAAGRITVTPLQFDLTDHRRVAQMRDWQWTL